MKVGYSSAYDEGILIQIRAIDTETGILIQIQAFDTGSGILFCWLPEGWNWVPEGWNWVPEGWKHPRSVKLYIII